MAGTTQALLHSIISTSRSLKSHIRDIGFKPKILLETPAEPHIAAPPLRLPYPDDVVETIRSSHVTELIRERLISRVDKWYQETIRTLQSEYTKTFVKLATLPRFPGIIAEKDLPSVYECLFTDKIARKFRSDIEAILRQALVSHRATRQKEKRKAPFNNECLPLLETYFEYNAYPSAQDRALLARKTEMCARQIEVWFQNHRTRAKKEGRQLRRLSEDTVPPQRSIESPELLVPKEGMKTVKLRTPSPALTEEILIPPRRPSASPRVTDMFCAPRPASAFPMKFRPGPDHVPCILSGKTWSFPPPVWPREASGKRLAPTRKLTITPDELAVELQQKLSLTGAGSAKRPQSLGPSPPAWYPTIVVPLAAPHFALVQQTKSHELRLRLAEPVVPLPARRSRDSKPTPFSKYERPTPYPKRHTPQELSLRRRSFSRSSLSPCSSHSSLYSDESELRTPSPSPASTEVSLFKGASTLYHYPDWDSRLLPT